MARLSSVALLVVGALGVESCRAPTNVIVTVTTDMDCSDFKGATVAVGELATLESVPESTESTTCDGEKRIGSVVLEPSDAEDGAIAFRVVGGLGVAVESCNPPNYGPGCIVARRALKYFPHDSLHVNLRLESSCAGIPCGTTETCVGGACYPATIDPNACEGAAGCDDSAVTGGNGSGTSYTSAPVRRLAVDDTYLYWGDRSNGNLMRQRKDFSTAPEVIHAAASGDSAPNGLFLAGGLIWWGSFDGGLYSCAVSGCAYGVPLEYAFLENQTVNSVAVAGNTVYFTTIVEEKTNAKGDLYFCPISGCPDPSNPPVFYESPGDPARVAVDANNVYWTWSDPSNYPAGEVRQCALSQGAACQSMTLLASSQNTPWGMWVDASTIYWVNHNDGSVRSCAIGNCNNQPTTLAENQGTPWGMAVDGGTIYWANGVATTGQIQKCEIASCNPTVVADNQDTPWDVVVDDKYVYWTNDGSTQSGVFRLPK